MPKAGVVKSISMAVPTAFNLRLLSSQPSTRAVADSVALALFDAPPPWVGPDWTTKFEVTWVPTPRHKARGSSTTNPSRQRVLKEMAKPRPGEVVATGFTFHPPEPGASGETESTYQKLIWGSHFRSEVLARNVGVDGLADPAMGPWALDYTSAVLSLAPLCAPSAAWFGTYNRHPFTFDRIEPDTVPGYGWLVTLPSRLVARLGAVESCPAELVRTVVTPDGDEVTVFVLTPAPAQVTEPLLREWRGFLAPVLDDNRLEQRTAAFTATAGMSPWQFHLPPMMLADDWPTPPSHA